MALIFLLFLISVGLGYFFFFIYLKKTKKAQEVRLAHLPPMTIFKTFLVQNKSSARICTMNFPPSQFALSTNLTDRDKLNEIRWLSGRSPHQHNFVCFSTQLANVSAGVPKGLTFESWDTDRNWDSICQKCDHISWIVCALLLFVHSLPLGLEFFRNGDQKKFAHSLFTAFAGFRMGIQNFPSIK